MPSKQNFVSVELIQNKIYLIRGQKVMLDKDLAQLYGVLTKQLNRQVRRNIYRFPKDFLIRLTTEDLKNLRCQIGTSSWGGLRYKPYAFTEQGVAMLSSVLNSKKAIQVNIQIMRVFTQLRQFLINHKELAAKLTEIETKLGKHDKEIQLIFEVIKKLMSGEGAQGDSYKKTKIGFIVESFKKI